MKILLINKFLYPRGGDAISTLETGRLLEKKGHKVYFWGMKHPLNREFEHSGCFIDNFDLNAKLSVSSRLKAAANILYSLEAKKKISFMLDECRPDIVHINNISHYISPSILHAIKKKHIPVVMTLRDMQMVCPTYLMLSGARPCEKCRNGRFFWCVLRKCTKGSYAKSVLNAVEMYLHHKIMHIYDAVDIFISPSIFLREKMSEMGFKPGIVLLPNFIELKEYTPADSAGIRKIVYFGRLSPEKGVLTLLKAAKDIGVELDIIGDGPIKGDIESFIRSNGLENVRLRGFLGREELREEVRESFAAIVPSECYENNPRSVLEAFALGKPVIASKIGGIPEIVKDNRTGLLFEPGDISGLAGKIRYALENPEKFAEMGREARLSAEKDYNPAAYYNKLMEIYGVALRKYAKKN
ncbi:MAG: glycosyltransferase family 4 protein [Candidatus Aureabacteria bacterium]|nr:glycosyltransferase family 4 protein [Candidatus Auribacterota bacterium]